MTYLAQQFVQFIYAVRTHFAIRVKADEAGASMVEYALLVALIAATCVGVLGTLAGGLQTVFTNVTSSL